MAHTDSARGAGEAPSPNKSIEQATLIGTLAHLWPYIWPADRADLTTTTPGHHLAADRAELAQKREYRGFGFLAQMAADSRI